jgi:hypothetical protein
LVWGLLITKSVGRDELSVSFEFLEYSAIQKRILHLNQQGSSLFELAVVGKRQKSLFTGAKAEFVWC